jgi:HicB family
MLYLLVPSRLAAGRYNNMPRKPADIAHVNLRIRESLRRELEREAKKHQVSLNYEITSRLQQTFEQQHILFIHQLAENAGRMLLPLIERGHELNLQGDLIRAVETLINRHLQPLLAARIISGSEGGAIRQQSEKIAQAIKMIDIENAQRLRRAHMPEAGQ